jgi:hypothetical protein
MSAHLIRLAQRVADDEFFLAPALGCYARGEGLDDAGLATRLGCDMPALTLLRLCRMPQPQGPGFVTDIRNIAERFALDPTTLAQVVRRGQNLLRMQPPAGGAAGEKTGLLLAARDSEPEPPDQVREGGQP